MERGYGIAFVGGFQIGQQSVERSGRNGDFSQVEDRRLKCRRAVNAAFDQGCRRRRPRSSTAAASSVAPIARAPSSPRTGISLNRSAAAAPAGQVEQHRAAQAKLRRAGFLGHHPPRDKEHHRASRKCRRESTPQTSQRGFRSRQKDLRRSRAGLGLSRAL